MPNWGKRGNGWTVSTAHILNQIQVYVCCHLCHLHPLCHHKNQASPHSHHQAIPSLHLLQVLDFSLFKLIFGAFFLHHLFGFHPVLHMDHTNAITFTAFFSSQLVSFQSIRTPAQNAPSALTPPPPLPSKRKKMYTPTSLCIKTQH